MIIARHDETGTIAVMASDRGLKKPMMREGADWRVGVPAIDDLDENYTVVEEKRDQEVLLAEALAAYNRMFPAPATITMTKGKGYTRIAHLVAMAARNLELAGYRFDDAKTEFVPAVKAQQAAKKLLGPPKIVVKPAAPNKGVDVRSVAIKPVSFVENFKLGKKGKAAERQIGRAQSFVFKAEQVAQNMAKQQQPAVPKIVQIIEQAVGHVDYAGRKLDVQSFVIAASRLDKDEKTQAEID